MTMTWQNGRQLASLQTIDNSVSYKYDINGMRTQKKDNSGTTYYYYDSNNNLIGLTKDDSTLLFYYDSDGNVTSFKYNGTMYYYVKNLQGDIVQIIDQTGTSHVDYVYDAWGNVMSEKGNPVIRDLNPFLYRSYVYDSETGLYYLQSRYYDPFIGRFLNADEYCDTETGSPLSTNMFAYCENNVINLYDPNGFAPKTLESYLKSKKNRSTFGTAALKLSVKNNSITITVGFSFFGDLQNKKSSNKTYKQLFINGIKKYWKGNFKIYGYNVKLSVFIANVPRNAVQVRMNNKLGISNVSRYCGNWSVTNHGKITMYKGDSRNNPKKRIYTASDFERVSAHEFGHVLGLQDLYNKPKNKINKYSYPGNYSMMGHQWLAKHINNYDLQKVLLSFMNNKSEGWT